MYEYWVFQDARSCNRVNAVATPLIDTAIAAQSASAEKRYSAVIRKSRGTKRIPKRLPTQRDIATTWTTSAPIASECDPPAAEWL